MNFIKKILFALKLGKEFKTPACFVCSDYIQFRTRIPFYINGYNIQLCDSKECHKKLNKILHIIDIKKQMKAFQEAVSEFGFNEFYLKKGIK